MTRPTDSDFASRQRLLAAWGLTTTAGWLLTQWLGTAGAAWFGLGAAGTLIAMWAALMTVPLGMTLAARRDLGLHSGAWAGLVALGLVENGAVTAIGGGHDHGGDGHGGDGHGGDGDDGHGDGAGHSAEPASPPSGEPGGSGGDAGETVHQHADGSTHDHGAPDDSAPTSPDSASTPPNSAASGAGPAEGASHTGPPEDAAHGDGGPLMGDVQHVSYYHVWFAIGAVGFAVSAVQAEGGARRALYATAAALNAAMVVLLVAVPAVQDAAFLTAAAIQGLPMLADLPLRRRAHLTTP